jgi:SAM-dependent methyltransferase
MTTDSLLTVRQALLDRLARYERSAVDETIAPGDTMFQPARRAHYFAAGRDAVHVVAQAMLKAGRRDFAQVLDLPCGGGRVLRHLVRFLPEARVIACDIDAPQVEFCARRFGAVPLVSREDLTRVVPDRPIDLLWCGSLLTHLPAERFEAALRHMVGWLSPGGVGVFTLHGRWSLRRQAATPYKYMSEETFAPVVDGVRRDGFGYASYPEPGERFGQTTYGISVSLPSWVLRVVEGVEDVHLLDYTERGWDNHQDVLVLLKRPIDARPWIFEAG